ncbi:amidohydrolase family protein [Spongiimicrobium sp. 3-5]|uniref:amidohydrolase family protein n=1 Tax=Spongiimicrobium sp. 3-5 TaxID=3332596 RepID=UPI00397F79C1
MKNLLSILILSLVILGCIEEEKETFDLAILNANTVDLVTGQITQQSIFIAEGRIKKITDAPNIMDYKAKETVDASETYVLPGFWDNHVHFRGGDSLINANKNFLNLFIANGITTVRDAGGDLTLSVLDWKTHVAEGKLIGPTIFTSGPKIDGPEPTWAGSLAVENNDDIAMALDSLQALGTDFVKLYDSKISGEAYLETIRQAEERKLITSGHMPFTVELDHTLDAGLDAIEHLYYVMKGCSNREKEITAKLASKEMGFWQAMPALLASYQDSTAQQTFANLKQKNVFVVPTLHIGETLSYLDEVDHTKDAYLQYMGHGIIKTYDGRIQRAMKADDQARKDRKALDTFFGQLTKSLNDAGVLLLAGSDSGAFNSYTYPGISLHKEMEAMAKTGMSPLQVLRTSAYNGALFLGKDADYGTIAVGKIADLVFLEGNPLEDITNTQRIFSVLKGNKVYSKQALANLLNTSITN